MLLDGQIGRMKQGLADGITNPKLVMRKVVEQFDALIAQGVERSTFYQPVAHFPDTIPLGDRARLTQHYTAFIRDELLPAHIRVRDFIRDRYLPKARSSIGLSAMPRGAAIYRYLVKAATTTDMTPEQVHAIGVSEVARIQRAEEAVLEQVGFKGSLPQFATMMRTDPRFTPATAEAMRAAFEGIRTRVETTIPRDFSVVPRSKLVIAPVPEYRAKTTPGGMYLSGTPDGSRPGTFFYNAHDLPVRFTWGFETLFLHEGLPGHHFQVGLAQENAKLPDYQRFGGNNAFREGWALYAESLGQELGMYTDPYQLYGHLNDEMLRAMRLVVDTGIHHLGWSRDRAVTYMLDHSAMGKSDVDAEVDRYIAIPGQALGYKIGELTIRRLRTRAERALGAGFDVREFHAQVLMSGALPMKVLERKIDAWIAAKRAA